MSGPRVAEPRPRIAVVVFPGSNDDRDAQLALERLGADAVARLARRGRAARRHRRGRPPRRVLVRRLPPLRRDRPLLAGHGARSPRFAADGGLVLGICNGFQILTEARPASRRAPPERVARVRLPRRRRSRSSGTDTPFTTRCEPGGRSDDPRQARRGLLVRRRRSCSPSSRRTRQILLRYAPGENPNGSVADVAGVVQRGRERLRPDAAPGARGRPAARLDRRRAASSARSSTLLGCRPRRSSRPRLASTARPSAPPRAAPAASRRSSAARSRSRSVGRQRHRPAPRDPVGRVGEPDERLAAVVSSSCTSEAKRLSPARCASLHLLDHRGADPTASRPWPPPWPRRLSTSVPTSQPRRFPCDEASERTVTGVQQLCDKRATIDPQASSSRSAGAARRGHADRGPSRVDRDVPRHRRDPVDPGADGRIPAEVEPALAGARACRRTARCPRASARRRRRTRVRPPRCLSIASSARYPAAIRSSSRSAKPRRPSRVGDPEPHDRDRRLVVVLLEEHPLQHLRALVRDRPGRTACPRRSTRGSRPTPPAAGRRRARASARAAPGFRPPSSSGRFERSTTSSVHALERQPEVGEQEPHLVTVARDRAVVENERHAPLLMRSSAATTPWSRPRLGRTALRG